MNGNDPKRMTPPVRATALLLATLSPVPLMISMDAHAVQPFRADYQFSIGSKFSGHASRTLTQERDGQWQYRFNAKIPLMASADETSWFRLDERGVRSVRHQLKYRIFGFSKNSSIQFGSQSATVNRDGKTSQYPIHAQTLDMLNMEMQLRQDLKAGTLQSRYWLSDDRNEDEVKFVLRGPATLTTPAGVFETVRIDRVHSDPSRSTSFWMAPKLDYLPVRVTQKDDKMTYDILLRAYQSP